MKRGETVVRPVNSLSYPASAEADMVLENLDITQFTPVNNWDTMTTAETAQEFHKTTPLTAHVSKGGDKYMSAKKITLLKYISSANRTISFSCT